MEVSARKEKTSPYADYCNGPDDPCRERLDGGPMTMTISSTPLHQRICRALAVGIVRRTNHLKDGKFFLAPLDGVWDDHNGCSRIFASSATRARSRLSMFKECPISSWKSFPPQRRFEIEGK